MDCGGQARRREEREPTKKRVSKRMVGRRDTEEGKGALTLPSMRPGVRLPPTSSSFVPPRVCHHCHCPARLPSVRCLRVLRLFPLLVDIDLGIESYTLRYY
ncbi:hypothetical protein HZH68_016859 [Vespula germanica]|uniref:Uncharacterized protein n=1 Tax=Vespula germanica TaxID=30212 RepID=A0A834J0B6_VESGE|nr:hypothetical protein HZH68_016859 [Vespula germanica]